MFLERHGLTASAEVAVEGRLLVGFLNRPPQTGSCGSFLAPGFQKRDSVDAQRAMTTPAWLESDPAELLCDHEFASTTAVPPTLPARNSGEPANQSAGRRGLFASVPCRFHQLCVCASNECSTNEDKHHHLRKDSCQKVSTRSGAFANAECIRHARSALGFFKCG